EMPSVATIDHAGSWRAYLDGTCLPPPVVVPLTPPAPVVLASASLYGACPSSIGVRSMPQVVVRLAETAGDAALAASVSGAGILDHAGTSRSGGPSGPGCSSTPGPSSFYIVVRLPSGALVPPPFLEVDGEPHRERGQQHGEHRPSGRATGAVRRHPQPLPRHLRQRATVPSGHQRYRLRHREPERDQGQPQRPPSAQPPRITATAHHGHLSLTRSWMLRSSW